MPHDTIGIYIIKSDNAPVRMSVDGAAGRVSATIPVGKPFQIDTRLLPVLETTPGIEWRGLGTVSKEPALAVSAAFDAAAIIAGNVRAVTDQLPNLSADQLVSVRDAENSRDEPRKGVLDAIDKAITTLNLE